MQVEVLHPNPEKGDVAASPVLIVATSDGVLRFFTLGSTSPHDSCIVQAPKPAPIPQYLQNMLAQVIACYTPTCASRLKTDGFDVFSWTLIMSMGGPDFDQVSFRNAVHDAHVC